MTGRKEESRGEIVLYQAPDGKVELNVRLDQDSLWLSQKQMSLLFDKDANTISLHLHNIYKEIELVESATTEESSVVQREGKTNRSHSGKRDPLVEPVSTGGSF